MSARWEKIQRGRKKIVMIIGKVEDGETNILLFYQTYAAYGCVSMHNFRPSSP